MSSWEKNNIHIKAINPIEDTRWDDFVLNHPQSSIYHYSAWGNVLKSSYNHNFFYLVLENSKTNQVNGVVPFILVESSLTGKRLVSLPFTSYCNPLFKETELEEIVRYILEQHPDIDYLELKFTEANEINLSETFRKRSSHVTHILDIGISLEQLFKSFHKSSIQQRIKRAKRENLKFRITDKEEDLRKFYELVTEIRKKHGLPPAPYHFFSNMWRILEPKNLLFIPLVEFNGEVIAGAIVLQSKDTYHFEYSASNQKYLKLCSNQKLIWEIIKVAHQNGVRYFDFGRSSLRNHSLIDFKERWAAERVNLHYYYFPAKRLDTEKDIKRKILERINRYLPTRLLQLEGKILYPHLS